MVEWEVPTQIVERVINFHTRRIAIFRTPVLQGNEGANCLLMMN